MTKATAERFVKAFRRLPQARIVEPVRPGKRTEWRVFVKWADGTTDLFESQGEAAEALGLFT